MQLHRSIVQDMFVYGYHVIRRCDHFRVGLSSDLIIEKVLMCSITVTGGLRYDHGLTELQRPVQHISMPQWAEENHVSEEVTGVSETNYCEASCFFMNKKLKEVYSVVKKAFQVWK